MNVVNRNTRLAVLVITSLVFAHAASADNDGARPCPVVPYDGVTSMDAEFGVGAEAITHCLKTRKHAKVVVSVDHTFFINAFGVVQKNRATFLSNIDHMVRNFENVHGMTIGEDVDVVVVFSESGAVLATTQHAVFNQANGNPVNPFVSLVEHGLQKGMKFYLCQTAARNLGITMATMIPGVKFVPGGHIAVADFQMQGYALIQP